ncbi:MAG TPA: hypothetical protein EYP33_01075, partial [Pyrodictium sp.]|nr:hypothetical protein [Pyrodictium sp.]
MRQRDRVKISLLDIIDSLAWITLGSLAIKFARTFEIEMSLRRAGLLIHPHIYAARALFLTFTALIASILTSSLVMLFVESLPICIAVIALACSMPLAIFSIFMVYPSIKASARIKSVDHELPFFAAYLTTMAYSGVPPEKVVEIVSRLKLFKGIREEAQRILRDVKLFGRDPLTAIENVAVTHPSMLFRELMLGYTTTIRTGGDVIHYLESRTQDLFRRRIEDIQ